MNTQRDLIDELIAAWQHSRPTLDPSPLAIIGRVLVLASQLERSVETALAKHGISLGQFDILATLRRAGPRGKLTPTELLKSVVLSSGAMTTRLDKLEASGLIQRQADPSDRRGVVIELTGKGKKVIDAATKTRFAEAKQSLPPLDAKEMCTLEEMLRRWLIARSEEKSEG